MIVDPRGADVGVAEPILHLGDVGLVVERVGGREEGRKPQSAVPPCGFGHRPGRQKGRADGVVRSRHFAVVADPDGRCNGTDRVVVAVMPMPPDAPGDGITATQDRLRQVERDLKRVGNPSAEMFGAMAALVGTMHDLTVRTE